jgi:hypothetical protein
MLVGWHHPLGIKIPSSSAEVHCHGLVYDLDNSFPDILPLVFFSISLIELQIQNKTLKILNHLQQIFI